MGAFGEFFGFDGRVGRLGYLWRSIVAVAAIALLAGLALFALAFVVTPDGAIGHTGVEGDVITAAFLLALWSGFALATRRLRDMGFEPVHIVPLYAALWVANSVLLEPLSRLDPRWFGGAETAWIGLQWLAAVPLLFWPPRDKPSARRAEYDPGHPTAYMNWRESV